MGPIRLDFLTPIESIVVSQDHVFLPNFWFANASSYAKFVKLLQDISMTSQFQRKIFAVLV